MERYDYIIVGAGAAGCVLANRLTEDKDIRVLLLEAGGRDNHPLMKMPIAFGLMSQARRYLWGYETEPEPALGGRRIELPRGRTLGGSTSVNGMLYLRGHARDYDLWRQAGLAGWSYADVLPYFRRLESHHGGEGKYHGGDGPVSISEPRLPVLRYEALAAAAANAGVKVTEDIHGDVQEGIARIETTTKKGERHSTASAYLRPALSRPNLKVEIKALSSRILMENGRATGIAYRQNGRDLEARADREVILSGGTYNSPQLLMMSGIGPADHLREMGVEPVIDLPGVGQNLSEHAVARVTYRSATRDTYLKYLRFDRATLSVLRWMLFRDGPFAINAAGANIFLRTSPELERPDVQLICGILAFDSTLWFPAMTAPPVYRFGAAICLMHPDSRGWVKLRSTDPADKPRIQLNLFKEKADRETMIRAVRRTREIYEQEPHASLLDGEIAPGKHVQSSADIEAAILAGATMMHHPVGTCAMGIGGNAVVDAELRVRGIDGLRVVDASVMPTVPGGNTNVPTIMIAEKAADMIRGRTLAPAEF